MSKVYIIAEIGVNHNGDIELAKKMIKSAAECGVDCVKFQTFNSEKLVTKTAKQAEYQEKNTGNVESQFDMLKKLELKIGDFKILKEYCKENKVDFLTTPFDESSVKELRTLNNNIWKIASGEITNYLLLKEIGLQKGKVILSTGMATIEEINDAVKVLRKCGTSDISILHCTTEYPAPFETVNLLALKTLEDTFKLPIGYSDHTKGIEVPIAAVALGSTIIEKHFTIDRNLPGPDQKASLEPVLFKSMVDGIRNIEKSIGNGEKIPNEVELKNSKVARKSIVASKKIVIGETYSFENLTVKRPGTGISPMKIEEVIGKKANKNYDEDDLIEI